MKRSCKYKKQEKGVTLIILVVTIVIMIILAGTTINMVFGENGALQQSQKTQDMQKEYVNGQDSEVNTLLEEVNNTEFGPRKPLVGTITTADNSRNIEAEDKNGNPITIPAGFIVLPHGTDGVEYTHSEDHSPTVEDGIVVQDSSGNQFVWVPVNDSQYTRMIDETNHKGNLYDFGSYNSSTQTWTTYTSPQIKTYSATGCREPNVVESYTNSSGTKYNGDEVASNYSDADIRDKEKKLITGKDGFQTLLQTEFNEMAASVKEYKGFYIGRYETGNLQSKPNTIPVVQRGNTNISNVNWYYMYANSKNIAKNDKYTSSMIWGCQWDRTLDWLVATNGGNYSLVTDSSSWGNYKDQKFNYTENGETKEKADNTSIKIPTGSAEITKKNNIYDMAGNVYEWTIEANTTGYRVLRRGISQPCKH